MSPEDMEKFKELAEEMFNKFAECDCEGIVSLWSNSGSQCFTSSACSHMLSDVMLDVGKRLAMFPPSMPELVEGHHILKSGSDFLDNFAIQVAMDVPPECQSIIVVFGDHSKNEGDTVFCMGHPSILTMLAIRSVVAAEESGDSNHHLHNPESPTGLN